MHTVFFLCVVCVLLVRVCTWVHMRVHGLPEGRKERPGSFLNHIPPKPEAYRSATVVSWQASLRPYSPHCLFVCEHVPVMLVVVVYTFFFFTTALFVFF